MSLSESLKIFDNTIEELMSVPGPSGDIIRKKCENVISANTDFECIKDIAKVLSGDTTVELTISPTMAALQGAAADILETLTEEQRYDFNVLLHSLELRFGEKCSGERSRLQLKFRYQGARESPEELITDIQRLSHLAFSDRPEVRQDLVLQHFIDRLRDLEPQMAVRLTDLKDIKSALVYTQKIEAALQVSWKGCIRAVSATDSNSDRKKIMESILREMRSFRESRMKSDSMLELREGVYVQTARYLKLMEVTLHLNRKTNL
nr:uncharacterized protein LOC122269440 [Parasteatoda tepidariorum]